jgi:DNA replication protein DnaC
VGNRGTGKTSIASALGWRPDRGAWASGLSPPQCFVHELIEARVEKRLLHYQKQLGKYSLLIIDELGYLALPSTGAELRFEMFSQHYERE